MKQRATTVEGIRLEPNWLGGYRGEINGRKVVARQESDRDWLVRRTFLFGVGGTAIGGGRTLREAVRMAKERV